MKKEISNTNHNFLKLIFAQFFDMLEKEGIKPIEIVNKDKLLTALVEKKMLSKGVKSFDMIFLKKSKELGLFSNAEIKEIEKPSLLFVEVDKDV